ncbi:MAG: hypothetical protein WBG65_08800 [Sulfurimonadaceae bacterium]
MKTILIILLTISNLFAWEVNTHRAIDRKALENVPNFSTFITDTNLENKSYKNEIFLVPTFQVGMHT